MVLELTALSLACNSAPVLSAEMDPVTGRPALTVSLDLKVRMDVVALVEILASIANSQVEGGEEEEEQTAEAGQEEEEEEGREETEAADDAALLTGKPRIRAEETARCRYPVPKTRFCWRDFWASRPRVIRSLSPETTFSRTRFLLPRRPHRVRKRLASGRGKLAAGIVEMCAASCNTVQILFGVLSSCGPVWVPRCAPCCFR